MRRKPFRSLSMEPLERRFFMDATAVHVVLPADEPVEDLQALPADIVHQQEESNDGCQAGSPDNPLPDPVQPRIDWTTYGGMAAQDSSDETSEPTDPAPPAQQEVASNPAATQGPFYPYPQVPLGWRKVTLEWDDGSWFLDFKRR